MNTQFETTQQRIVRILAGNFISAAARDYIEGLAESYGLKQVAALDYNDRIGLSVFEDEAGKQHLHYDDYGDSARGWVEASYCNIEQILDAAESNDAVPAWWPDEATVILVECDWNGFGSRFVTKGVAESENVAQ
ncbi:hypothetical protein MCEMSEM22_00786 [Comamonadaceae bacterium]